MDNLKTTFENIKMPDDMKQRIIEKCRTIDETADTKISATSNRHTYKHRKTYNFAVIAGLCACIAMLIAGIGISKFLSNDTVSYRNGDDTLTINMVNSASQAMADIGIYEGDYVEMSYEQLTEYYGKEIKPAIPTDLETVENTRYGIYKRDNGTGEIYYDNTTYRYVSNSDNRTIQIQIAKDKLPLVCTIFETANPDTSVINDTRLIIHGLSSNRDGMTCYYTRFIHDGIGYDIETVGLTTEELYNLLSSLLG